MADQDSIWFRLGYTLEKARGGSSLRPERLRSLDERELDADDERHERRAARKVRTRPTRRPEPARMAERPISELDTDDDVSDAELALAMEEMERADVEGAEPDDAAPPAERSSPLGNVAEFLKGNSPTGEPWEAVIAAAGTALVGRLLEAMPKKRSPGMTRLLHAAAAGAGAALIREALKPVLAGQAQDRPFAERARGAALSGSARGLLYGGLIEPRIPGPPLVRGAIYGAVEHLATPMGGLTTLAGARAPHRNLPFVGALFDGLEPSEETLLEHVLFGVGMAALYGARPADPRDDDDDEDDD